MGFGELGEGRQAHALLAQQIDGPLADGPVLDCCRKREWTHAVRTLKSLLDGLCLLFYS